MEIRELRNVDIRFNDLVDICDFSKPIILRYCKVFDCPDNEIYIEEKSDGTGQLIHILGRQLVSGSVVTGCNFIQVKVTNHGKLRYLIAQIKKYIMKGINYGK